jgi:hypothetical protein
MGTGADTADTLCERPGITGIATLQNNFKTSPHGPAGNGIGNYIIVIDINLCAHMTLDPGDRVDHDALSGIIQGKSVG